MLLPTTKYWKSNRFIALIDWEYALFWVFLKHYEICSQNSLMKSKTKDLLRKFHNSHVLRKSSQNIQYKGHEQVYIQMNVNIIILFRLILDNEILINWKFNVTTNTKVEYMLIYQWRTTLLTTSALLNTATPRAPICVCCGCNSIQTTI